MLLLLEKEQRNEEERQKILLTLKDERETRRLEKLFALERAKAAETIKKVTREHEVALALKLKELKMLDEEDDELEQKLHIAQSTYAGF